MQTIRFSKIVESCGEPESYLLLMDPAKDREFQAAIKADRVMTLLQPTVGTKSDRGVIGFEPGRARQFLVFPKTLRPFKGRDVVGIKYDLLLGSQSLAGEQRSSPGQVKQATSVKKTMPAEKNKPTKKPAVAEKTAPVGESQSERKRKAAPAVPERPAEDEKLIAFKESENEGAKEETIPVLKRRVRHALSLLDEGKRAAALALLKRIVEE